MELTKKPKLDLKAIGERLTKAINNAGYGQKRGDLCKKIGVPSQSSLTGWEKGTSRIGLEPLVNLCHEVNQSVEYILFGEAVREREIDYGPMEKHLRLAIDDIQARNHRAEIVYHHVASALSKQIKDEATKAAVTLKTLLPDPNFLMLYEAIGLEEFSLNTVVASPQMRYNFRAADDNTAGAFDSVNARNLNKGRSYRFLMARRDKEEEGNEAHIARHKRMLQQMSGNPETVLEKCEFASTDDFPLVGFAIYELDVASLKAENLVLYERLKSRMNFPSGRQGGHAGFFILPSHDAPAFIVMDKNDVERGLDVFDTAWKDAKYHFGESGASNQLRKRRSKK